MGKGSVDRDYRFSFNSSEIVEFIDDFNKDTLDLINCLAQQNEVPENICSLARQNIQEVGDQLQESVYNRKMTKNIVKIARKKDLKTAKNKVIKILTWVQIETLAHIASKDNPKLKGRIEILALNGVRAKIILLLNSMLGLFKESVSAFKEAKKELDARSKKDFSHEFHDLCEVENDKYQEFNEFQAGSRDLSKRNGVIGVDGEYRIQSFFSVKKNKALLKSFVSQKTSYEVERTEIQRTRKFEEEEFTTEMIPLNGIFDNHITEQIQNKNQSTDADIRAFGRIFGEKGGISSGNRFEPHLINGWETSVFANGKRLFHAIRHAIASDKTEKNRDVRKENSKKAAKELLMAALLQSIADRGGLTEEERANGIQSLNFNSVSLVTGDTLRSLQHKYRNEKRMLRDQQQALLELEEEARAGTLTFDIGGESVKLNKLTVATFNFGVNKWALRGFGVGAQKRQNARSLEILRAQFQAWKDENPASDKTERAESLFGDIEFLMKTSKAHLKGGFQYEVGAKILLLSNLMDENGSTKCAFNCMSGKDRTGVMDGFIKALVIMCERNKRFPTHEELIAKKSAARKEIKRLVLEVMIEMGGFEVTKVNTRIKGYKVDIKALKGLTKKERAKLLGASHLTKS